MTVNLKSPGVLARLRQSDLWWSFTHQRSAVFAAVLLTVLIVSAFTAPLYAPQNPFDPAQLELWNAESINSTLSQLRYYKDGGYFKHADDLNIVLDSFQKCLDHIELEVEKGIKFMPGDPDIVYRAPIQFYVNEVIIGSNTILLELNEEKLSFVTYNVLSYLITKDARFNEKAFANFFTLVSRSSQISGTGEKDRNRFFNAMREKVNALRT